MYELRFRYRFEAAHRFTHPGAPSCNTPHGHTWYATLHLEAGNPLDSADRIEEFGALKKPWQQFITQTADHSFLHHEKDPILPALRDHIPGFRGLPFPGDPTTELVSRCFFEKALKLYEPWRKAGRLRVTGVTIEETPTNHVYYSGSELGDTEPRQGWWTQADPADRRA